MPAIHRIRTLLLLTCLLGPLCGPAVSLAQQDSGTPPAERPLHPGLNYMRAETMTPRRMVVHALKIDTAIRGLRVHTTTRRTDWQEGIAETDRQTTRDYLRMCRADGIPMIVALNADAFSPWPAPYNKPTPADLQGLAISDGLLVSAAAGTPSLIHTTTGEFRIETTDRTTSLEEIAFAVSGFAFCLKDGQPVPSGADLHPRTGLGLSQDQRFIVVVAIDGRQPASEGATTQELGEWLKHFGAHQGINMDGGGSTTLAWWDPSAPADDSCRLLNSPVGNGIKVLSGPPESFVPTERANGNNFGFSISEPPATPAP